MTKQEKYTKEIKNFLNKYFKDNIFEHKTLNYANSLGFEIRENYFIIKTKNAGFVMIHPEIDDWCKPYKYSLFTQKFVYKIYNEKDKIFTWADDKRFKKNNYLCQNSIEQIKNFILS